MFSRVVFVVGRGKSEVEKGKGRLFALRQISQGGDLGEGPACSDSSMFTTTTAAQIRLLGRDYVLVLYRDAEKERRDRKEDICIASDDVKRSTQSSKSNDDDSDSTWSGRR